DETHRVVIAFSTQPDQLGSLDSLWTAFNSGAITLDAPAPRAAAGLRLSVAPNPARGAALVTWALPRAQRARGDVLDVSGRRVTTPAFATACSTSSAASVPRSPSKLPPPGTESMCEPKSTGGADACPPAPRTCQASRNLEFDAPLQSQMPPLLCGGCRSPLSWRADQ
ncbi:MAG: hypothetical protein ABL893_03145, partial [Hyphomicrobium sp.]